MKKFVKVIYYAEMPDGNIVDIPRIVPKSIGTERIKRNCKIIKD